jgi:hypothetical protein
MAIASLILKLEQGVKLVSDDTPITDRRKIAAQINFSIPAIPAAFPPGV